MQSHGVLRNVLRWIKFTVHREMQELQSMQSV